MELYLIGVFYFSNHRFEIVCIILIIFFTIILLNSKIKIHWKGFNDNYLDIIYTKQINGLFVWFVFMHHFSSYITYFGLIDKFYPLFRYIGQGIVCSFLFYSGFGICEQISKNRKYCMKKLITKKLPYLFLQYSICVILYIFIGLLMGYKYSITQIILAFIGWTSVGNSNWYIYYIFVSYIFIFVSFNFIENFNLSIVLLIILNILYVVFCYNLGVGEYYYVTSFILPLGMLWSKYRDKIDNFLSGFYILFLLISLICYAGLFLVTIVFHLFAPVFLNIVYVFFTIFIIMLTKKIYIDSKLLSKLGCYVFEIYILQRLPMNLFKRYFESAYNYPNYVSFFILSLVITLLLSILMNNFFNFLKGIKYD